MAEDNNVIEYERTGKLKVRRYFSQENVNPFDRMRWTKSEVDITDEDEKILFRQKDSEAPEHFSTFAKKIVFSRFSYGENGTSERETSLKKIIGRVSETYGKWAVQQSYMNPQDAQIFTDEIATIALEQRASFNSPVWFNVGTDRYESRINQKKGEGYCIKSNKAVKIESGEGHLYPQTSACFIQSVEDDMDDIMDLAAREARLYKYGSGTGTDLSTLRSSREKLSGGGKPSGPLAYQMFYDRVAGIVKSGGKTRRAAQMKSLKDLHPDIWEFIEAKEKEEEKAKALMKEGYSAKEASQTVAFQNANLSIRISDEFMQSVITNSEWRTHAVHNHELDDAKNPDGTWVIPRYRAKDLFQHIAKAAWNCGDPGVQFDDTINRWHTCPNSGRINASNPCSEYMFIDDSSCNLASINIMKFRKEDGTIDIEGFKETIETMVYAMNLNYDNSSFPTKKIAENSHKFGPLGLGYANLGAYIMSLGLPYDSEEGRAVAASLTSLLTATAYEVSAEMAAELGAFEEYEKNKEPMLKVMEMHRDALSGIDTKKLPVGLEKILEEAEIGWDNVLKKGRRYGFRNAQATVLAPTGTIGFMMDCDTKGIEPELALVQYKNLAEGGTLRMVNQTVSVALQRLRYSNEQIKEIIEYVAGHENIESAPGLKEEHINTARKIRNSPTKIQNAIDELVKIGYEDEEAEKITLYVKGYETMEGAPHIRDEHLAVFDTSLKSGYGKRTISYKGHIDMMAAVQPFISGAISKTVNMPETATKEEIAETYMYAWKKGLKSVSLYRDNSKAWQVANVSKKKNLEEEVQLPTPVRVKLPYTRDSKTHKFSIAGGGVMMPDGSIKEVDYEGYFTLGFFQDGKTPGELFVTMSHEGSLVRGLMDTVGTLVSIGLQHGVPFEAFRKKVEYGKFGPSGIVKEGDPEIHVADSIIQYIFSAAQNIIDEKKEEVKNDGMVKKSKKKNKANSNENIDTGSMCPNCRGHLIKRGGCEKLCTCGYQDFSGCGS